MTECQIILFPTKPKPVIVTNADIVRRIEAIIAELLTPGHPLARVRS